MALSAFDDKARQPDDTDLSRTLKRSFVLDSKPRQVSQTTLSVIEHDLFPSSLSSGFVRTRANQDRVGTRTLRSFYPGVGNFSHGSLGRARFVQQSKVG